MLSSDIYTKVNYVLSFNTIQGGKLMATIGEVNSMANKLDFVLQSAQQNPSSTNNINQTGQLNTNLKIPDPLPNAFGGMTGKETVFDIQMQALQGDAGQTESPDGMGDIVDIMA